MLQRRLFPVWVTCTV